MILDQVTATPNITKCALEAMENQPSARSVGGIDASAPVAASASRRPTAN